MSVTKIRHTGVVVSDLATPLPFYRGLLDLEVWWDRIEPGARMHTVKLKAPDGVSIKRLQYLDALYRKALAQGIHFNTAPVVAGGGKAKVTYCRDAEGVILELVEILA